MPPALYEWNYPKQMLRSKLEEIGIGDKAQVETGISARIICQATLIERFKPTAPIRQCC